MSCSCASASLPSSSASRAAGLCSSPSGPVSRGSWSFSRKLAPRSIRCGRETRRANRQNWSKSIVLPVYVGGRDAASRKDNLPGVHPGSPWQCLYRSPEPQGQGSLRDRGAATVPGGLARPTVSQPGVAVASPT